MKSLKTVTFAENSQLVKIGGSAFQGAIILNIKLPNSVENINSYSFDCENLKIKFGTGIKTIEDRTFGLGNIWGVEVILPETSFATLNKYISDKNKNAKEDWQAAKEEAKKEWEDDYDNDEGAPPFTYSVPEPEDIPNLKWGTGNSFFGITNCTIIKK